MNTLARAAGVITILMIAVTTQADTFGSGANAFNIDFVTISGSAGDSESNQSAGSGFTISNINNDYRIGTYEVTNDQWSKFKNSLRVPVVTGNPSSAYDENPEFTGTNVPTNNTSWYEAAQFVNYLNTSKGYQAAYKFTGTQGTGDYTLATWDANDADGGTNLYRHKDAVYYMPTENEWVKAAYWNGTALQTYATKAGESLTQGDGVSGTGWNYYDNGHATNSAAPWDVGSGSEELNGTFDMMGNVWEWTESPYSDTNYGTGSFRGLRSGAYYGTGSNLASSTRISLYPDYENYGLGFRVASNIPEPATLLIMTAAGIPVLLKRRRSRS